ncbi:MAG: tetratricopeptide repeat protein [Planctomycetota bacterium]|jgi:tetratricopeptide (TPR) repeat protein
MIRNKRALLAGIIIITAQVVWIPTLWSANENKLLKRVLLLFTVPIGIGLFLSSIENKVSHKEAVLSAMNSGDYKTAADILDNAIKSSPGDAGLYCTKALALMFAGRDSEAKACIDQSLSLDRDNQLTQSIAQILEDIASGKIPRPKSMKEI